jgi:diguanylate cyclase (GGDEF)-like protein/PAS domain S-box-containing protein
LGKGRVFTRILSRWLKGRPARAAPEAACLFDTSAVPARARDGDDASSPRRGFRWLADLPLFGAVVSAPGSREFLEFNERWCDMLGFSRAELTGLTWEDLTHPDDVGKDAAVRARLVAGELERYETEQRFVRKDGSMLHAHVEVTAMRGAFAGRDVLASTVHDITRWKMTDSTLRLAATVFDSTIEGIMVTDSDGVIVATNRAFSAITGYEETELVGRRPNILSSGRHTSDFYARMWTDVLQTGSWQGEVWNRHKSGRVYPSWVSINAVRDSSGQVVNYVAMNSDITQIKRSQDELAHQAHHDQLTGLPNRLLFQSRLDHALDVARRRQGRLAILFLDLDGFKHVNDSLGHPVGDDLLCRFSERLSSRVRAQETLARLGGDEFVILIEQLGTTGEAAALAEAVLKLVHEPFTLENVGHEVYIGTSIGISLYPDDAVDATALIKNADTALYQAKAGGRNTYRFYSASQGRAADKRMSLGSQLRKALDRDEFILHYQPQFAVGSNDLLGAEVLLRWQRPDGTLVKPHDFVPLAEDIGLILPLGERVLRMACEQLACWLAADVPAVRLGVNFSVRQFESPELEQRVLDLLHQCRMPPHLLEIEITESVLMAEGDTVIRLLNRFKEMGLGIAIDDFGTGYSSLGYLKRFRADRLKIDRSFVRDLPGDGHDREIVSTIVSMARSLGLEVLAEGVERIEQLVCLEKLGCDAYQGYLGGVPLPADAFAATWLARDSVTPARLA